MRSVKSVRCLHKSGSFTVRTNRKRRQNTARKRELGRRGERSAGQTVGVKGLNAPMSHLIMAKASSSAAKEMSEAVQLKEEKKDSRRGEKRRKALMGEEEKEKLVEGEKEKRGEGDNELEMRKQNEQEMADTILREGNLQKQTVAQTFMAAKTGEENKDAQKRGEERGKKDGKSREMEKKKENRIKMEGIGEKVEKRSKEECPGLEEGDKQKIEGAEMKEERMGGTEVSEELLKEEENCTREGEQKNEIGKKQGVEEVHGPKDLKKMTTEEKMKEVAKAKNDGKVKGVKDSDQRKKEKTKQNEKRGEDQIDQSGGRKSETGRQLVLLERKQMNDGDEDGWNGEEECTQLLGFAEEGGTPLMKSPTDSGIEDNVSGQKEEETERRKSDELKSDQYQMEMKKEDPVGKDRSATTRFEKNVHEFVSALSDRLEIQKTVGAQMAEKETIVRREPIRAERLMTPLSERKRERKGRVYRLLDTDIAYCEHMLRKHGENYEAMSKDSINAMRDSPAAIQRKLRIYKDFLKQENEALS